MALNPAAKYPGQINTGDPAGYPYGRARNETTPGDRNGTPWEEAHVSDLWGFEQAMLSAAGIVPSGTPDKVGASQYLEALRWIATHTVFADGIVVQTGALFTGPVFIQAPLTSTAPMTLTGAIETTGAYTAHGSATINGAWTFVGTAHMEAPQFGALPILQPALSVRLEQSIAPAAEATNFAWSFSTLSQSVGTPGGVGLITIPISRTPNHSTLTAVRFTVVGSGYTTLPSNQPTYELQYVDSDGSIPAAQTVTDSVSLGTFNSRRVVTLTLGTPIAINHTDTPRSIYVRTNYDGSGSAGASRAFRLERVEAVCTATRVNP
jgi:hypothetical protein